MPRSRQHSEKHWHRQKRIGPGGIERGLGNLRLLRRRLAFFDPGNKLLLSWPDNQPNVEPHDRAEERSHGNPQSSAGAQESGISGKAAPQNEILPEDQQETGQKGEHRSPAEPPECTRHQLGDHFSPGCRLKSSCDMSVDEVKKVQNADPGNSCHKMDPAKERLQYIIHVHGTPPPPVRMSVTSADSVRPGRTTRTPYGLLPTPLLLSGGCFSSSLDRRHFPCVFVPLQSSPVV